MKALILFILSLVTFATALETQITIFFQLTYLLLGLLILAYVWAWLNLQRLSVKREVNITRAQVGEYISEHVVVENGWLLPKLWVEVRDHSDLPYHQPGFVSYLGGRGKRHWVVRTPCTLRGKFTLGPVSFHTGDPFGIFQVYRADTTTSDVLVYPATLDISHLHLPISELQGGQAVRMRTPHTTPNVATIREYVPGDSFNRIHWLSTARTGKLTVKEFELDPDADIWLVLDMQESSHFVGAAGSLQPAQMRPGVQFMLPPSTEEYAVTMAASLARHLLSSGRNVGLISWGQHYEVIPPARETRQLFKILEALAILRAHGPHPLMELLLSSSARFSRNTSIILITSSPDPAWVTALQQLATRGIRPTVVYIDPQSFGDPRDSLPLLGRLSQLRIPAHQIKQGDLLQGPQGASPARR